MDEGFGMLTVFFEEPFWVGLFERVEDGRLTACRVVFGAEPRDPEILALILKDYAHLRFSPAVAAAAKPTPANRKRAQRQIARQLRQPGAGTKAQQALKLQQAQGKQARKAKTRAEKTAQAERRFALKQQQRKEKHRGH